MEYEIACRCGRAIRVREGMAGSSRDCECGGTVLVPLLSELRAMAVAEGSTPLVADPRPPEETAPELKPKPIFEIIAPTQVSLRTERGPRSDGRALVMAALTADAIWIQDTWRLRSVALSGLVFALGMATTENGFVGSGTPRRSRR